MKTIALNMIVGPGDGELLDRCLQAFDAAKIFNEIVIVLTTKDEQCREVAFKYTKNVYEFKWTSKKYPYGDFAGARNVALQNTTSDYIMWLDCDDLPGADFKEVFSSVNQVLGKFDYFTIEYNIAANVMVKRERIFRNGDLFWQNPVHEQLSIDQRIHTHAHLDGISIVHAPVKIAEESVARNLSILKHEHTARPSPAMEFYYANELLSMQNEEGVEILEKLLHVANMKNDMLAQVCLALCRYYKAKEVMDRVETLSRIGLSYNSSYADFIINLAEINESRGDVERTIELYKKIFDCKIIGGGVFNPFLYTFLPAIRLTAIYDKMGDLESALLFSKIAFNNASKEDAKIVKEIRIEMLSRLLKKECAV